MHRRPSPDHPILQKVRTKALDGPKACIQLLEKANLAGSGTAQRLRVPERKAEGARILKTMNDFHRTAFTTSTRVESGNTFADYELLDTGEVGYHFTRALFDPRAEFQEIFTRPRSLRAIRESKGMDRKDYRLGAGIDDRRRGIPRNIKGWDPVRVQAGKLIGIQDQIKEVMAVRAAKEPNDIHKNHGAGFLGSSTYLKLNIQSNLKAPDGGLAMHRRHIKNLFKDLLCRELPVLRPEDVAGQTDADSALPFRHQESCMQCHATMDPAARVTRNLQESFTSGNHLVIIAYHEVKWPAIEGWPDRDLKFSRRPPTGHLYFRTISGELIDEPLDNLQHLGNKLATLDDPYVCAAKRYFQFFTGVNVELFDDTAPLSPVRTDKDKEYFSFVQSLGRELKEDQDLKAMIQKIFASTFYLNPLGRDR